MEPIVLFGIQFTLSLLAYTLIAFWYVVPRLSGLPREAALMPLLWIHVFRMPAGQSWLLVPSTSECQRSSE